MITTAYILTALALLMGQAGFSQTEVSLEQYHYMGNSQAYTYMPVMHIQDKRNWYAEARYNYEDLQTFSLYMGRSFTGDRDLKYTATPLLGGSVGRFKGVSAGLNLDLEYYNFYLSAQSQYSFSTNSLSEDFMYYWSEAGYQALNWLYAGISWQQTRGQYSGNLLEKGLLIGFSFKQFTVPVYAFTPFNKDRYFILGFTYSWASKRTERKNPPVVKGDR
jgi:hypothetical protein